MRRTGEKGRIDFKFYEVGNMLNLYTDGSCLKNPNGCGGWAVAGDDGTEFGGDSKSTTNNRMELMGVIGALTHIVETRPARTTVHTDSKYVCDGANSWIKKWIVAGRLDENGRNPVKNCDLWRELATLMVLLKKEKTEYTIKWVKAHSGVELNERADTLAYAFATECRDGVTV